MLETIIVVLLILWLIGAFGGSVLPALNFGGNNNLFHILLIVVVVLVIVRLARSG